MDKLQAGTFKTLLYADITTTEINGLNIVTYKVLFNNPFENEYEVLEILNYLEKSGVNYIISCNGKDITKDSLSAAVGESYFSMNEDAFLYIQAFIQKIHKGSILSANIEKTKGYITGEVSLILPNK